MGKPSAYFYYDLVSPFAYLYTRLRRRVAAHVDLIPVPVFLGGLLREVQNVGPAEVPSKRAHLYDFCIWRAHSLGIPMRFPPSHPFSSLAAMRLMTAINADWDTLDRAFSFVWVEGRDPSAEWDNFCNAVQVPAQYKNLNSGFSDQVKASLAKNTKDAASAGVFGVPSVVLDKRVFWGVDTIEWLIEYLENPQMFEHPDYARLRSIRNPLMDSKPKAKL